MDIESLLGLFEAVLASCLPITPASIVGAPVQRALHPADGRRVSARIEARLRRVAGTHALAELLHACLHALDRYRLSRQLSPLTRLLEDLVDAPAQPLFNR